MVWPRTRHAAGAPGPRKNVERHALCRAFAANGRRIECVTGLTQQLKFVYAASQVFEVQILKGRAGRVVCAGSAFLRFEQNSCASAIAYRQNMLPAVFGRREANFEIACSDDELL